MLFKKKNTSIEAATSSSETATKAAPIQSSQPISNSYSILDKVEFDVEKRIAEVKARYPESECGLVGETPEYLFYYWEHNYYRKDKMSGTLVYFGKGTRHAAAYHGWFYWYETGFRRSSDIFIYRRSIIDGENTEKLDLLSNKKVTVRIIDVISSMSEDYVWKMETINDYLVVSVGKHLVWNETPKPQDIDKSYWIIIREKADRLTINKLRNRYKLSEMPLVLLDDFSAMFCRRLQYVFDSTMQSKKIPCCARKRIPIDNSEILKLISKMWENVSASIIIPQSDPKYSFELCGGMFSIMFVFGLMLSSLYSERHVVSDLFEAIPSITMPRSDDLYYDISSLINGYGRDASIDKEKVTRTAEECKSIAAIISEEYEAWLIDNGFTSLESFPYDMEKVFVYSFMLGFVLAEYYLSKRKAEEALNKPVNNSIRVETSTSKGNAKPVKEFQYCRKCGAKIPIDSVFCTQCGTKVLDLR